MKREMSIFLLLIFAMICCACASKEAATEAHDLATNAAIYENHLYSAERSVDASKEMPEPAEFEHEPLTFVTFEQHSNSVTADNGTKLFVSRCYMPNIVTEDAAVNHWITTVATQAAENVRAQLQSVEQWANETYRNREEDGSLDFYTYSYYTDVSIERLDNIVLSALRIDSIYSGGAHPNYGQMAYNLDLSGQIQLSLADVIQPESIPVLQQKVLDELEEQFGGLENSGLYADYPQIVASYFDDPDLTPNWYFSGNGLVIYFNCYDIAPYAAGIIKVQLPYDSLDNVLSSRFLPENTEYIDGRIVAVSSAEGRNLLPVQTEGECLYLSATQTVYDVRLYRLNGWITDDVPVIGQMEFAANRLTAMDAVAVPAEETGYLLTYRSGTGAVHQLEINGSVIREIVAK